mgnify:CR=1 FL=1
MNSLLLFLIRILDFYTLIIFFYVVVSWLFHFNILNSQNVFLWKIYKSFQKLTDPPLNYIRRYLPTFGGIDILINNASAIGLTMIEDTTMKRYDLMHNINVRGTFMVSKACIPHLKKGNNPHILTLSPPIDMDPKWFGSHVGYTMAKYTMSMCVLGMAEEFKDQGVAVNALWPRTAIATAAVQNHLGGDEIMRLSRNVDIMADAAYTILTKDSKTFSGNFCIDDIVLFEAGVKDFTKYANVPFAELMPDFFVPDNTPLPDEVKNS